MRNKNQCPASFFLLAQIPTGAGAVFTYNAKPHRDGVLHTLGGLRTLGHRGAAKMDGLDGLQQRNPLSDVTTVDRRRGIGIIFPCPLGKYKKRNNN